jgi:hypothetical protein
LFRFDAAFAAKPGSTTSTDDEPRRRASLDYAIFVCCPLRFDALGIAAALMATSPALSGIRSWSSWLNPGDRLCAVTKPPKLVSNSVAWLERVSPGKFRSLIRGSSFASSTAIIGYQSTRNRRTILRVEFRFFWRIHDKPQRLWCFVPQSRQDSLD